MSLCKLCVQTFREEIAPLSQDVRIVNELSAELTPLDIQLSSTASRQLDQLNIRWKLLQVTEILRKSYADIVADTDIFLPFSWLLFPFSCCSILSPLA